MKIFSPKLFSTLKDYNLKIFSNDVIAGIIVAIIALPLSIALAIASGVSPEKGLYTAIIAGFIISFLGGSKVNISGPTAAFATIVAGIVSQYEINGLIIATLMAGIILIIMGLFKLGALIKYIPHTITTGFTSGIAVTIVIGQLKDFFGLTYLDGVNAIETTEKLSLVFRFFSSINFQAVLVGAIALFILIIWPKISKKIPGSLIAVIIGIAIVKLFNMEVNTIGDLYKISRSVPQFNLPDIDFNLIKELIPCAFTIAILAAIESLLSCVVSDGMIKDRHNSNTELIAQGAGNIFSALFGGIPATGAIARTAANVNNGGKTPISGMVHAAILFLILVILMPYAALIPMPVIAAVLFMVAYNMCEWKQFVKICRTATKSDIIVLILTFVLTVVFDLVVAIEIGLLLSIILFVKRMTDVAHIRPWTSADEASQDDSGRLKEIPPKAEVFEINGPMFFATSDMFLSIPLKEGTKVIIIRMRNVPSLDVSALRTLTSAISFCENKGVKVILSHVNEQPLKLMKKSGLFDKLGDESFAPNIDKALEKAKTLI